MIFAKTLVCVVLACILVPRGYAAPVLEAEPNDESSRATQVACPGEARGTLTTNQDTDCYRLTVPVGGLESLCVEAEPVGSGDLVLSLLDENDAELTGADYSESDIEYLTSLALPAGEYTLKITTLVPDASEVHYSIRLGTVPAVDREAVHKALNRALDFLAAQQQENGSCAQNRGESGGISALVCQAFIGAECLTRDDWPTIYRTLGYLKSLYHSPAEYPEPGQEHDLNAGGIFYEDMLYDHGMVLTALIEAYVLGVRGGVEEVIPEGLSFLLRAQATEDRPATLNGPINTDSPAYGGWRYAPDATDADLSVSGWQIIALLAAQKAGFDVPRDRLEKALRFVRSLFVPEAGGFREQGSFSYQPGDAITAGRAAMGVLSMQLLGAGNEHEAAQGLRYILYRAPTWCGEYNGNYPFYYWYYGTRAAYLAGGQTWDLWSRTTCNMLVQHQSVDGSWEPRFREESHASSVYTTALGALILEYCCGSVPIYMRTDKAPLQPIRVQDTWITVQITQPGEELVTGMRTIVVRAESAPGSPVSELRIAVDGEEIYAGAESAVEIEHDFGDISGQVITAQAVNAAGSKAEARLATKALPPIDVDLTATVMDAQNNYILDLEQGEFVLSEDGIEQRIIRFSREQTPVSMVVVLDASGSMKKQVREVHEAAVQFVSQIRTADQVAVLEFADSVTLVQGFSSDIAVLGQAIRAGGAKGGTALYDAVIEACHLLGQAQGRRSVILLTDGKDENNAGTAAGSTNSFEQCLETVRESEVAVFPLGLGLNIERSVLETIAQSSGGRAYFPPTIKDLQEVYGLVAKELRSQYSLGYSSTNRQRDGAWRGIELAVPGRDVSVRTKKGYIAPEPGE